MDVAASFRALAPAARLAAQVLGSIYPLASNATELARVLRVAGIKLDGKPVTTAAVTRAAEEAVESGLVAPHRRGQRALVGVEQAATWLTREALRGGILEPIRNAHGKEAKASSRSLERDWGLMEVRCSTVSGNFEALGDRVRTECWSFLAQPGAADLLATLPERFRDQALQAERAAVAVLAAACPRLAGIDREPWSVQLPAAAHSLELLEQLAAANARCLWPHGQPYRIVRGDAAQLKLRIKSSAEWLRASGELPIDPRRTLDLKQLFTLLDAQPGARFLELTGGEFLALTESFRRQLDDLRGLSSPAEHGEIRLHALAALSLSEFVAETQLEADTQWAVLQQRLRDAQEFDPEVPAALRGRLRSYQLDGFRWLARLSRWGAGACLADDMGLGKTIQALALLLDRAPAGPALVVAPTSVVANWVAEARRFAPQLNAAVYAGEGAARARLLDVSRVISFPRGRVMTIPHRRGAG